MGKVERCSSREVDDTPIFGLDDHQPSHLTVRRFTGDSAELHCAFLTNDTYRLDTQLSGYVNMTLIAAHEAVAIFLLQAWLLGSFISALRNRLGARLVRIPLQNKSCLDTYRLV
jgi:hypothetical protein